MDNNDDIIDAEIIYDSADGEAVEAVEEPSDYWKLIAFHLQSNHNPPIPLNMVDTCIRAIEYANEGEWKLNVVLPEGTLYKGANTATVETIVESHHLHNFVTSDREVVTVKDANGTVIYQGYGTELKLETTEPNTEIEKDDVQE
jgi:(2Fe-2S) ferredoxin